jgi:riboflavin synthase
MFTGIISALGHIQRITALGQAHAPITEAGARVRVHVGPPWLADVQLGDSIACSGACMTVVDKSLEHFDFEISPESLRLTSGLVMDNGLLNLEKAMSANDRYGGHIVTGHVDGLGKVAAFDTVGDDWKLLRVTVPQSLAKYFAIKGSIVINGVSLTVNAVRDHAMGCDVDIQLIPHTLQHTNLHALHVGSLVNVEVDLIARYLERMLSVEQKTAFSKAA